ncbi:tetratricopeptide repeat protein [bacterium]|nr:tetratricopeptide repeat protein [bacterium]
MVTKLTAEESQQLLQTVEMFEAITAVQAQDYQSLEILKEAYGKLGRTEEMRGAALRLGAAYASVGQLSEALQEYESILRQFPGDDEATAALASLEASTTQLSTMQTGGVPPAGETSKQKPPRSTPPVTTGAGAPQPGQPQPEQPQGDQALADLLIAEKLVTPQAVQPLLNRLQTERQQMVDKGQPPSLIQLLVENQLAKLDDLLALLVTKSGKPYLPLSCYDIDRDTAFLVPRELAFANCLVPFDVIGRAVLVATTNPFDNTLIEEVEGLLSYRVFWYISPPVEINTALRRVHGLDTKSAKAR